MIDLIYLILNSNQLMDQHNLLLLCFSYLIYYDAS